jgi:hypothetical protein
VVRSTTARARRLKISFGGTSASCRLLAGGSLECRLRCRRHGQRRRTLQRQRPTALQFAVVCGPASNPPPANANFAHFVFEGSYDGVDGYTLEVWASDHGEPGSLDSISMTLRDPASAIVYETGTDFADDDNIDACVDVVAHQLDNGNLQIHSGLKD